MHKLVQKKKRYKRVLWLFLAVFLLLNILAIFHSYKFTHFTTGEVVRTEDPSKLSAAQKISTLFFGVDNPRPANKKLPSRKYETVTLQGNKRIECWSVPKDSSKGTVVLFHGFSGNKSLMLDEAEFFYGLGYSTLLVDFMGSGGSEGSQTTIGYFEAEQVKTCFDYLRGKGEKNVFLFGTSMGAVAIMKAVSDYGLAPAGIVVECPFGSMYKTVCARFKLMNAPAFPMAGLLVFWGGVQNGFWAFGHNPTEYAKTISCPTLLLYGAQDKKVSREEIDEMYAHLKGQKQLKVYEAAGHENLSTKCAADWRRDLTGFLNNQ